MKKRLAKLFRMCYTKFTNKRKGANEMDTAIKTPIDMANYVLKKYSLESLPINLALICEMENIKIEIVEGLFIELEEELKKDISGIIFLKEESKTIYVRFSDIAQRKNFTIAHELGHYFMHSGFYNINNNSQKDNEIPAAVERKAISFISFRADKNIIEREANRFAAELLMPKDILIKEYHKIKLPTCIYLAEIFDVSNIAMKIRMDELGLKYYF